MCLIVFRNHQATTGFLIETMHHARPKLSSNPAQVFDMMKQSVDQSPRSNAGTRMNNNTCGFIDDENMRIFEKYPEWNIFGLQVDRFRFRLVDDDGISASHLITGA